jgi:hypothetical protein
MPCGAVLCSCNYPKVLQTFVLYSLLLGFHYFAGKATAVGAVPGVTRSVQNRIKVSDNPLIYLLDTPGILTPNVPDVETGLRLALCGKTLTFLHYVRSWVIMVVLSFTEYSLILYQCSLPRKIRGYVY